MSAPPKFVTIDGVKRLNPEFKKWKQQQGNAPAMMAPAPATGDQQQQQPPPQQMPVFVAPAMPNEMTALPVVTHPQELECFGSAGGGSTKTTQNYNTAMESFRGNAHMIGLSADDAVAGLMNALAVYEVPQGLISKLFIMSQFDEIVILCDDSGSMSIRDAKTVDGRSTTRWEEALLRFCEIMRILAWVPALPPISLCFLNRATRLRFERPPQTEPPQVWSERVVAEMRRVWTINPNGTTPLRERLQDEFSRFSGKAVAWYVANDGVPSGAGAVDAICRMIRTRAAPARNPVTFLICSSRDSDVDWISDVEEQALYCSAIDDPKAEMSEISRDQGSGMPASYGLWLVAMIVGANYPQDLDALDEGAALPKYILEEMLGYELTPADYYSYFDAFVVAQRRQPWARYNYNSSDASDRVKRDFLNKWAEHREEFLTARAELPLVAEYRAQLRAAATACCGGCVVA